MHLGKSLTRALKDRGQPPADFAKELGVSAQRVNTLKNNRSWNATTLVRVCGTLKISLDEFIGLR